METTTCLQTLLLFLFSNLLIPQLHQLAVTPHDFAYFSTKPVAAKLTTLMERCKFSRFVSQLFADDWLFSCFCPQPTRSDISDQSITRQRAGLSRHNVSLGNVVCAVPVCFRSVSDRLRSVSRTENLRLHERGWHEAPLEYCQDGKHTPHLCHR